MCYMFVRIATSKDSKSATVAMQVHPGSSLPLGQSLAVLWAELHPWIAISIPKRIRFYCIKIEQVIHDHSTLW